MKNQTITIRIDSDKYDRLSQLAASMERTKSFIIDDAIDHYLTVNEWQVSEINKALIDADNPTTKWVHHSDIEKEFLPT